LLYQSINQSFVCLNKNKNKPAGPKGWNTLVSALEKPKTNYMTGLPWKAYI